MSGKRFIDTFTNDEWLAVMQNLPPEVTVLEAENYVRELRTTQDLSDKIVRDIANQGFSVISIAEYQNLGTNHAKQSEQPAEDDQGRQTNQNSSL